MMSYEEAYRAETERLQFWIDEAFAHASSGDAHAARVALTSARWGEKIPKDGREMEKAA